ncbi:hypothetical protein G7046_g5852 [Stylonectria norvegica]|nr:hypothetical protein G7046_g5852 [Stylonectria norvegica]
MANSVRLRDGGLGAEGSMGSWGRYLYGVLFRFDISGELCFALDNYGLAFTRDTASQLPKLPVRGMHLGTISGIHSHAGSSLLAQATPGYRVLYYQGGDTGTSRWPGHKCLWLALAQLPPSRSIVIATYARSNAVRRYGFCCLDLGLADRTGAARTVPNFTSLMLLTLFCSMYKPLNKPSSPQALYHNHTTVEVSLYSHLPSPYEACHPLVARAVVPLAQRGSEKPLLSRLFATAARL